ncbi:MAG TPA: carboxypeptidase-like regulatory domain-containing protein [Pyrinomonadaceae bacterium]|nr:carboxypeptidase-like regulatory domain-containing protein [Pyrinomonadaceae bacterium]
MRKFTTILMAMLVIVTCQIVIQAQITTGSISGTVTDQTGAVVPGANVNVKGEAGQVFTAVTKGDGGYTIPGVPAGGPTYTVTITAPSFKTAVIQNVKVDVATPATVNAQLEPGNINETVIVASGAEVLQTETATVGTTIAGRQILETPIQSRDALDLVTTLPGTTTTGVVRTSSINGLPKSALTIQIDGVDVQDNFLKSSDGFFTFIRPRIDAIDEVTVSTATPGAESSGDGAVGIRFATRRGTDDYHGSAFWQHRDEGLNTNNFQNNYNRLPKNKLRLNQFGGSFGGPIPLPNFGEHSDGPMFDSGRGKAYFFFNYERFHLNETSPVRTRQVLTSEAQNGIFRYGTNIQGEANGSRTVNVLNLAAANGLPNTLDPTVTSILNTIRSATAQRGNFQTLGTGNLWFRQPYQFSNDGQQRRRFLVLRMDGNITKNHQIEGIWNDQPFRSNVDFLNNVDPSFPGIANAGTQNSDRRSLSIGLRSSFGSSVVNQFRYAQLAGWLGGASNFDLVGGKEFWQQTQGGFNIALGSGLTGLTIRNAFSSRVSPTADFTDNVSWIKGTHTMTFGGQLKKVETISDSANPVVSTVTFGAIGQDTAFINAFSAANFPGANGTELANARAVYATLTGRISAFNAGTVYLDPDGVYRLNTSRHFEIEEHTNGLFAQDSWRARSNLTLTYGIRWQPQLGAKLNSANYAMLTDPTMVWDVSGVGNQFSPGTLTGKVPEFRLNELGEKAFRNDMKNFAPSFGAVWSPNFGGAFGKLFGRDGNGVLRGGFSRSYIREGTLIVENSLGVNPGGLFGLARNPAATAPANLRLTPGTLFRTPGNPNLSPPSFDSQPDFPRPVDPFNDAVFGFSPDFRSGYVDSWSFGYQRQLGRDTVVEFRYVGNRGKDMQSQFNLNEVNAIENGLGAEFRLAQQNLIANINAGRFQCSVANQNPCLPQNRQTTFAYFGAGTGTSPLPIALSYFAGFGADPNAAASYINNLEFSALNSFGALGNLNPANPQAQTYANNLDGFFRDNTLEAGPFGAARPVNFVHNCPNTFGFCYQFDNSEKSWFDAGVIEVRRRLSNGLRFQASYQYGKSYTNAYASAADPVFGLGAGDQSNVAVFSLRNRGLDKSFSQIDLRHAFKFDATWDLPFGKGRKWLGSSHWAADAILGGWTLTPIVRWQSGAPILMENISLVGMTAKELQDSVGVYHNQTINGVVVPVSFLPADIIENTIRANTFEQPQVEIFNTNGTLRNAKSTSGYAAGQAPTGRFIAPAGFGNCQARTSGDCGFRKFVLFGPNFFKVDSSIGKRFAIGEKRNVEFRMTAFDVLNHTNWRLGGWGGNVNNITVFTGTFGQMLNGWAFSDPNGSNDPGGRILDFMVRINF